MNDSDTTIRPANIEDIPSIVKLINAAYRDDEARGWTTEADIVTGNRTDAESITMLLNPPDSIILVMEVNGAVGACIHLQSRGDEITLGMFAVIPKLQGHGLGKSLLHYAEQYAHTHMTGKRLVMIVVGQREELIEYYVRRGYQRKGDKLPYPIGQNVGKPRVEGLYLETLSKPIPEM